MTSGRRGKTTVIYKHNLQKVVDNLLDANYPYDYIINYLKKHHGVTISKSSISYHRNNRLRDIREQREAKSLIASEERHSKELFEEIIDSISETLDNLLIEVDNTNHKKRIELAKKNIMKSIETYQSHIREIYDGVTQNYYRVNQVLIEFSNHIPRQYRDILHKIIEKYQEA